MYVAKGIITEENTRPLFEPVRSWITWPDSAAYGAVSHTEIACGACKHLFNTIDNSAEGWKYCPVCGERIK